MWERQPTAAVDLNRYDLTKSNLEFRDFILPRKPMPPLQSHYCG